MYISVRELKRFKKNIFLTLFFTFFTHTKCFWTIIVDPRLFWCKKKTSCSNRRHVLRRVRLFRKMKELFLPSFPSDTKQLCEKTYHALKNGCGAFYEDESGSIVCEGQCKKMMKCLLVFLSLLACITGKHSIIF